MSMPPVQGHGAEPGRSIDAQILAALRQSPEISVSGIELSQRLGMSRAAIWARIEALRSLGYEIIASPHAGYRLIRTPNKLHADDLLSRLPEKSVVGRDIRVFQETNSTNDQLDRWARDGAAEGLVVFAESQTAGRGRLGRKWSSPSGLGLWFSVLLRPKLHPQSITCLTLATAAACARAIQQETQVPIRIKWPNDLLIEGRKVAGILTELSAEMDGVKHVIIGIGVDVNQSPDDFPPDVRRLATSLRIATGQVVDRPRLAAALLRELDFDYRRVLDGKFNEIAEEWERQCSTIGCQVSIEVGGRRLLGVAEAIDSEGALLLRTEHGRLERVIGGDVTLQK